MCGKAIENELPTENVGFGEGTRVAGTNLSVYTKRVLEAKHAGANGGEFGGDPIQDSYDFAVALVDLPEADAKAFLATVSEAELDAMGELMAFTLTNEIGQISLALSGICPKKFTAAFTALGTEKLARFGMTPEEAMAAHALGLL